MTQRKIPSDAFEQYVDMGRERSYQALADSLSCSKTAIANRAKRDDWSGRLAKIEADAIARSDAGLVAEFDAMRVRHTAAARKLLDVGLAALAEMEVDKPSDAVKLIEAAVRIERLTREEPVHRVALQVERIIEEKLPTPFMEAYHSQVRGRAS